MLTYDPQLPARYGRSEPRHQPPPIITGNTVKQLLIRPFIELCQDMEAYKGRYTSVSLPARSSRRTTGPHTGLPSTGHSAPHTHHRRSQSAPTCSKKKLSHFKMEEKTARHPGWTQGTFSPDWRRFEGMGGICERCGLNMGWCEAAAHLWSSRGGRKAGSPSSHCPAPCGASTSPATDRDRRRYPTFP